MSDNTKIQRILTPEKLPCGHVADNRWQYKDGLFCCECYRFYGGYFKDYQQSLTPDKEQ